MRTFDQMPSASRKVSSPDSLEMPAPVSTTIAAPAAGLIRSGTDKGIVGLRRVDGTAARQEAREQRERRDPEGRQPEQVVVGDELGDARIRAAIQPGQGYMRREFAPLRLEAESHQ